MEQAIQDLLYLSRRLQGVVSLVPFLEEVNSLDNQINERKDILGSLRVQQDDAKKALEDANRATNEVLEKNKTLIVDAEINAEAIINSAKEKAKTLKDKTKAEMDKLTEEVNFQLGQVKIEIENYARERDIVVQQINELRGTKQVIESEIADLKKKLGI